jgi:hypothetical protein
MTYSQAARLKRMIAREEHMKTSMTASLLILASARVALGQDPGWPRQLTNQGNVLVYYHPQVDDWKGFTDLTWRMAFSLTPAGGKQVLGVVEIQGHTNVDNDNKMVTISDMQITGTHFPSLDPVTTARMDQMVRAFLPPTVDISLHRLVAVVQKTESVPSVPVNNDPPAIVVTYNPAILLGVDGEPSLAEIPKTKMEYVVNTSWPLFFERSSSTYYVLVGQRWLSANSLDGPWLAAAKLPKDMSKVVEDPQFAGLKAMVPPPLVSGVIPQVFYSNRPAEIILFDGTPVYAKIR